MHHINPLTRVNLRQWGWNVFKGSALVVSLVLFIFSGAVALLRQVPNAPPPKIHGVHLAVGCRDIKSDAALAEQLAPGECRILSQYRLVDLSRAEARRQQLRQRGLMALRIKYERFNAFRSKEGRAMAPQVPKPSVERQGFTWFHVYA
jgi:hypothetical protein